MKKSQRLPKSNDFQTDILGWSEMGQFSGDAHFSVQNTKGAYGGLVMIK